jgi:MATE family multidrug resistance protein
MSQSPTIDPSPTNSVQNSGAANPWRHELRASLTLAWPLIMTNLTMALIGATDVLMLGWLGAEELAGASLGYNLSMVAAIFCMGLVTATSPMMATAIGRKLHVVRDLRRTFRQGLWVSAMVIIPCWLVLWYTESLLLLMGQIPLLAEYGAIYIKAYMWCLLPFLGILVLRNFLSAIEKPMWSLIIGIFGVIANATFNYALIFGNFGMPALGLTGAGIGSILSNSLMFVGMVLVVVFHKDFRRYHLFGNFWRPDWSRFREIWRLGAPIAISFGLESGVFSVAVMLMGLIDTISVAAHAIAIQIASLTFMVPMGLGQAATVRVGIGYGRGDNQMIHRAGWTNFIIGVAFMTAMAVLIWSFPELLISAFIDIHAPENIAAAQLAVSFLYIAALFQIVDGAQVVGTGMLRGLHDTRVPMFFGIFGYWGVGIGVGIVLAFSFGWDGVGLWAGLAIGLGIVAVLVIARWLMRARIGLLPA